MRSPMLGKWQTGRQNVIVTFVSQNSAPTGKNRCFHETGCGGSTEVKERLTSYLAVEIVPMFALLQQHG